MLCLLIVGRRKKERKKERNSQEAVFPGSEAGNALLTVLHRIFVAVRGN
jgi:hypothetical protein